MVGVLLRQHKYHMKKILQSLFHLKLGLRTLLRTRMFPKLFTFRWSLVAVVRSPVGVDRSILAAD
jgi:hypothetical protein